MKRSLQSGEVGSDRASPSPRMKPNSQPERFFLKKSPVFAVTPANGTILALYNSAQECVNEISGHRKQRRFNR